MSAQDIELCQDLCPDRIYQNILSEVEAKEKAVSEEISEIEAQMWKLFGELMDADCLNSSKPD